MSLVDKLKGIHRGDLLLLEGKGYSAVGYVEEYSVEGVILSTQLPLELQYGNQKRRVFHGNGPTKIFTKGRMYSLKHFDSYQVLTPKKE